ncbi:MAG: MFS transporter [Clostridia bacterium]|nr:MFS transporter [Clostridia bacterium]
MEKDLYKTSRIMYIIEAGLEYLISILFADAFLATLTASLGMSDSLTGIISSFISLGCVFQLIAMFISKGRAKKTVISLSILNQILFMLLYVIPLAGGKDNFKITVFVICILLAYFVYNIAHPKKINWLMSLVPNGQRGRFTAIKEIISLIIGMIFSFTMGSIIDHFRESGDMRTAFVICAIVVFVLMILHTLTMILTKEKPMEHALEGKHEVLNVLKDKNLIKVCIVFLIWYIATYSANPFYGTYQTKELGFSLTFVSILSIVSAIARVISSVFMGAYADKRSFAKMIRLCFTIAALAFLCNVFCVPENGKIMFAAYRILYSVAMGGINSALINLCYDYVSPEKRVHALAVTQALAGLAGFFSTLIVSMLVGSIQENGNTFMGMYLYAQQVVSAIAFVLTVAVIVYVSISLIHKAKYKPKKQTEE